MIWSDATDSAKAKTQELADHVREVLTGYRSGTGEIAREGEPRLEYHPQRPLRDRQCAKASELGVTPRTIERWVARYRDAGAVGLVDNRRSRPGGTLANYNPRWVSTAQIVLDEQTAASTVAKKIIIDRITARLARLSGDEQGRLPSRASAYAALHELDRGRNTFSGSTKAKRASSRYHGAVWLREVSPPNSDHAGGCCRVRGLYRSNPSRMLRCRTRVYTSNDLARTRRDSYS